MTKSSTTSKTKRVMKKLNIPDALVELEPVGMAAGPATARPVMLFKEIDGETILPVWLSPIDAGLVLSKGHIRGTAQSSHDLPMDIMAKLGVQVTKCTFTELKGHQQYVRIELSGARKLKFLNSRADHAISFCLQAKARFFCTRGYMRRCQDIQSDIHKMEAKLLSVPDLARNPHPYLN